MCSPPPLQTPRRAAFASAHSLQLPAMGGRASRTVDALALPVDITPDANLAALQVPSPKVGWGWEVVACLWLFARVMVRHECASGM